MILRLVAGVLAVVVGPAVAPPVSVQRVDSVDDVQVIQTSLVVQEPSPSASDAVPSVDAVPDESQAVAPGDGAVVASQVALDAQKQERVLTPVVSTEGSQTVGITWPVGSDPTALDLQVRVLSDGEWGEWTSLDASDEAPDAGTADARHERRGGTDPLWMGDAEALQVSFSVTDENRSDDLSLTLVRSSDGLVAPAVGSPSGQVSTAVYQGSGSRVASEPTAPHVVSRTEWGARPSACTPDVATTLVGAVVHHTATSNNYSTKAEAEQQIRNIQAYHIDARGWCDIGYNFLVDKWGNLYEGRAGSLTVPVIGVHAGGFNTGTVGVSMLGDYTSVTPPTAVLTTVGQIIGWRLGYYAIDPSGAFDYTTGTGENSRYQNETVHLPRVFGHRDVAYTACPGDLGYPQLPTIRRIATESSSATRFSSARALVKALYADLLQREAEPSGVQTWSELVAEGASAAQMVTLLTSTTEYRRLRVRQAYQQVLNRDPDETGLSGWVDAIAAGTFGVDDVVLLFYRTPEFYQQAGNQDVPFIGQLYQRMLGRAPSDREVAYWQGKIASVGRAGVASGVWFSQEAAQARAAGYYQLFLGRDPEWSGKVYWGTVMLIAGEPAVRVGIAGSPEYWNRAKVRYPA